nr:S1 domain containing protein [Haemonchus contortus]
MSTKWKERNSRKNRKNRNHLWNRDFRLKDDGQEYGRVLKIFGNRYVLVFCSDNKQRVCRIRGRLRKNVKVRAGGIVLVELRDYQDYKGDIIYKYTYPEAQLLKKSKKVPLQPTTDECPLLVYGQIARVLSKDRVLAFCVDGKQRVCRDRREHAYGKDMLMARGDIIVIECRDHQDFESDIIHKCAPDEAQRLKDAKILPDHMEVNNGALLEYGRVTQKLHNRHVLVQCFDGEQRVCRIQGKRGKRTTAGYGQTVLVGLRDREDSKGIILHKSNRDEAQRLMENNKLSGRESNVVQKEKKLEDKEVMIHSENLGEEEQVCNNMPSRGNGGGLWHSPVGASRTRRKGMPWVRHVEDRNVVKGLTRAQNKRVIPSVDPAIEEKRILMKMSLMKILLECEENNIYVPAPSTTTPMKTTPSKEDILGQLMENQILKHELLQKKFRLADMQIEYFARQLERESKG